MQTIDAYSNDTGITYTIEIDGEDVTITWTDADGIDQLVDARAPGGVLLACDVPTEDAGMLAEEVARLHAADDDDDDDEHEHPFGGYGRVDRDRERFGAD